MRRDGKISVRESLAVLTLLFAVVAVQVVVFLTSPQKGKAKIANEEAVKELQQLAGNDSDGRGAAANGRSYGQIQKKNLIKEVKVLDNEPVERETGLFAFDPNTITLEQLQLLGLTSNQAKVVINYRSKGGRFFKREDFRKIYSLPDGFYERVQDSIVFDKRGNSSRGFIAELNSADSASLTAVPGIGPYFASAIVRFREKRGGVAMVSQLLEIKGMDSSRLSALMPYISIDTTLVKKRALDNLSYEEMSNNPYIGTYLARSILRLRDNAGGKGLSLSVLLMNQVINTESMKILRYYFY
jgi:DNA uptake protein ComE-like DNA-binding protein